MTTAAETKKTTSPSPIQSPLAVFGGPRAVPEDLKLPTWPTLSPEDIEAGAAALRKAAEEPLYLSAAEGGGPTGEFEEALGKHLGIPHVLATSGGGPALHIAVVAAGIEAGDEVIVSPYTWGQTISCILQQCAIPVFADVDPDTGNIDPVSIERRITPRTKGIVVVHIFGHPADMDPILEIARRHRLVVIEDAAQAAFARYKGRPIGTLGDVGCFSMGSGKNFVGGEGGALVTRDEGMFKRAIAFGTHPMRQRGALKGFPELETYATSLIHTYRPHPIFCVLAGSQLRRIDAMNESRRRNAEHLARGLAGLSLVEPPTVKPWAEPAWHIWPLKFRPENAGGLAKPEYVRALMSEGVPIGRGYVRTPFHMRPAFRDRVYWYGKGLPWSLRPVADQIVYREGDCPAAERLCRERELVFGAGPWIRDLRPILDRWIEAFRKVEARIDELLARRAEIPPLPPL